MPQDDAPKAEFVAAPSGEIHISEKPELTVKKIPGDETEDKNVEDSVEVSGNKMKMMLEKLLRNVTKDMTSETNEKKVNDVEIEVEMVGHSKVGFKLLSC